MNKIGWCTQTINPIIGCRKISPGCDNCYAERMAFRLACGLTNKDKIMDDYDAVITFEKWNGKQVFRPSELEKVKKWRKPQRIFVGSMGDVFHQVDSRTMEILEFAAINQQHTWLFLTKRAHNYAELQKNYEDWNPAEMDMLWFGVTAENQKCFDERMAMLEGFTGQIFVSFEPLLGPIDISKYADRIKWAIIGGETGPGAREMEYEWVRSLSNDCLQFDIPIYFKQWGKKSTAISNSIAGLKDFPEGMKGVEDEQPRTHT